MNLIIDASVLIKLFVQQNEPNAEQARWLLEDVREGYMSGVEINLISHELLMWEILNVCHKSKQLSELELQEIAEAVLAMGFEWLGVVENELYLKQVVHSMKASGLTAYDATYLALANQCRALLVTADQRITGGNVIQLVNYRQGMILESDFSAHNA